LVVPGITPIIDALAANAGSAHRRWAHKTAKNLGCGGHNKSLILRQAVRQIADGQKEMISDAKHLGYANYVGRQSDVTQAIAGIAAHRLCGSLEIEIERGRSGSGNVLASPVGDSIQLLLGDRMDRCRICSSDTDDFLFGIPRRLCAL